MNSPLTDLLKRALMVGALEVKLVPGRRTIVVLAQGESEVKGDTQTPERILDLLSPVMTAEARRGLASGWAEWEFRLENRGPVRACVEMKMGLPHVSLFLDRCDEGRSEDARAISRGREDAPREDLGPRPVPREVPVARAVVTSPEFAVSVPARRPPDETVRLEPTRPLATQPPLPSVDQLYDDGMSGGSTAEIDELLGKMLELKASDLHVSSGAPPMLRVDGEMVPVRGYGPLAPQAIQRMLLPIVPPRNREEFTRSHDSDFAYELPGRARFRANIFVDLRGMGAVLRVIPSKILSAQDLNLPKELLSLCHLPKGLVLVTGPTGSGKSTTLAALIDYINSNRSQHIITIEDPVEFVHPNKKCLINQRQVGEHTDSFKRALRAALREDPDIVLLGEMRDLETIAIALETAETGHLVFGTLHTSSAPATVDRIIDQYPAEQQNQIRVMLANSLKGVICQMLCKKQGGGRVAALEVMFGIPAISNLIRESKIFQIPTVMQTARKVGMCLMNDSLIRFVKDGVVAPEEALSKSNDKAGLQLLFQQANIRVPELAG
ncbi:MAG TPA: type IV pilus twitching motility protein PilT [Polyangiaceae bacterium]|nr:type IV pilus twitching motility protein PilT [Polyangiaceae bacterium]